MNCWGQEGFASSKLAVEDLIVFLLEPFLWLASMSLAKWLSSFTDKAV